MATNESVAQRLRYFINPVDGRYEDLRRGDWKINVFRDFMAGLIVAMVAIPLAMGFAMASGLRPEQGIVGGAVAGLIGALFGGSKYQVYGPTAAFIPVIGGLMAKYDHATLVLASLLAGVILVSMGVARMGRFVARVPHSIVVGFTIGIAVTIALSQLGEVLGLKAKLGYGFVEKISGIAANIGQMNVYCLILGLVTFGITKALIKVSPFLPAPLIGIGVTSVIAATIWADKGLILVKDKYGRIPTDFSVLTSPAAIKWDADFLLDLGYFVAAIVFRGGDREPALLPYGGPVGREHRSTV
jgi:SulP family sulfate permease